VLIKREAHDIVSCHQNLIEKINLQYKRNVRKRFHYKLEKFFSRLDVMTNACLFHSEEDSSWVEEVLKFGANVGVSLIEGGAKFVAETVKGVAKGFNECTQQ